MSDCIKDAVTKGLDAGMTNAQMVATFHQWEVASIIRVANRERRSRGEQTGRRLILVTWCAEEDAIILKLHAEGYSAMRIATKLPGRSRSSVIGRITRLRDKGVDLPSRKREPKPKRSKSERKLLVASPKSPISISRFKGSRSGHLAFLDAIKVPVVRQKPTSTPVLFEDLKLRSCRFALWRDHEPPPREEQFFCGDPIERGSYCAEHAELCYQTAKPSREAPYRERRAA